jgi:lysophospholipase L1-like esterase
VTADPVSAFLRGCVFAPHADAPYPRANLDDRRLPADIAAAARVPATVCLAVSGPAEAIELSYTGATPAGGMRGPTYGTTFAAYPSCFPNGPSADGSDRPLAEVPASPGAGTLRLPLPGPGPVTVYLPEGMAPRLTGITGLGDAIAPGPPQRRLLAYGDSITEGWGASAPGRTWLATAARRLDLEAVNFGYAGSGRGELVVAEAMAAVPADVITVAFGTNCWGMIAFSEELLEATVRAFVASVRVGHPHTPIVAVSPIVRPDAENTPNRLGATLAGLRGAYERAMLSLGTADAGITLVRGGELVRADQLADGIHPDDAGHAALAVAVGMAASAALASAGPQSADSCPRCARMPRR